MHSAGLAILFFITSFITPVSSTLADDLLAADAIISGAKPDIMIDVNAQKTPVKKPKGKGKGTVDIAVGRQCYVSSGGQDLSYRPNQTIDCGNNPCMVQWTYNLWGGMQRGCYSQSQCYFNSSIGDYCVNNASAYAQDGNVYKPDLYWQRPGQEWLNFYCCCTTDNCNYLDPFRLAVNFDITPPTKTPVKSCFMNGEQGYNLKPTVTLPCNVCLSSYNFKSNQVQRWCGDAEQTECKLGTTVGNFCHNLTVDPTTTVCCCTGDQCNEEVPGVPYTGKIVYYYDKKPYYTGENDDNDENTTPTDGTWDHT